MNSSINRTYSDRINSLKRRRDFLSKRIANYEGKNPSWDKQECKAIDWALGIVEAHHEYALDSISEERKNDERNS